MMRIVVTGARGQLGAALAHEFTGPHEAIALGHADLDVTDDAAVASAMEALRPDVILNAAAYNDVDGAEDHPLDALNLNAFAVRALARAAERCGAALVHYSTDFVFDGVASQPYTEDDRPNPQSVYAASKLLGEWFAADLDRHYVLRVESLFGRAPGGPKPKGSIGAMLRQLVAGEEVRAYEDRTVSPTYVCDAARATRELLERAAPAGLYHCVNSGTCTWLELARELARQLGVEGRLVPVRINEVTLRVQRPKYCALSNQKLAAAGIAMPVWQDALARYVESVRISG
ncbi:MAG TPA: dTDP-4-dehydrorhamnose reductase [Vicinamibacterales bacterium]|nr:dTDP-4-dehydrorhamnose reductase [Vicinamibacterales bacterium]